MVDSGLKAYRMRQEEEEEGVRPMRRPKNWNKDEREEAKYGIREIGTRKTVMSR